MKRLLVINTNFPPSTSIGTQRILRISKYLDRSKWSIHVLTLHEKYYREGRPARGQVADLVNRLAVHRTGKFDPLFYLVALKQTLGKIFKRKNGSSPVSSNSEFESAPAAGPSAEAGLIKRWLGYLVELLEFPDKDMSFFPFAVLRGWRIIRRHKIDVIYTSSPPHSLHLSGAVLKLLTGKRLIVDFRDPWARSPWHDEEREASGFERFKHSMLQRLEKWVVRKADKIVFVSEQMCADFINFYADQPREKFIVFFNGYDPDNIRVPQNGDYRKDGADEQRFVFTHTGTLYKRRDPTPLMYAVQEMLERGDISSDRVVFRFIGVITEELIQIRDLAVTLGIEKIIEFLPPVSYEESFSCMMKSDVLVLLQPLTRLQIPGKFYDYICFEKPILAIGEKDSAVESLVKERFGVFTDIQNKSAMQDGILSFLRGDTYDTLSIRKHREIFNMSTSVSIFEDILVG